jgi:signal transduction histidine kinase
MSPQDKAILKEQRSENRKQWAELILSVLVLAVLLLFGYTEFFLSPYLGFAVNVNTNLITNIEKPAEGYLKVNDQIVSINDAPMAKTIDSIHSNPFIQTEKGDIIHITLIRNGEKIEVNYPKPDQGNENLLQILSGDWILPLPFFVAGLVTILFIRPRSKTRTLLYLFFYFFAIWISGGLISSYNYWGSSMVMRIFIWLSVPVSINLHWLFPKPFPKLKKIAIFFIYTIPMAAIPLEFLGVLPKNLYLLGFLISIFSALIMLTVKFFRFQELRAIMRNLLFSYFLSAMPLIAMVALMLVDSVPPNANIALIGLTTIPGFYFFTAYRTSLKRDIPRVNVAMRMFTGGILFQFVLTFLILIFSPDMIKTSVIQFVSFMTILIIGITDLGVLFIIPALANDQVNLFQTETFSLRFSANRAASFINFLLIVGPLYFLSLILIPSNQSSPFFDIFLMVSIAVVITGFSIIFYRKFQKMFDRFILGIHLPPDELIYNFTQRITASLDNDDLAKLLKFEVIPSLLIRESMLCIFQSDGQPDILFKTGIGNINLIPLSKIDKIKDLPYNQFSLQIADLLPWVRQTILLSFEDELVGLWCLGRKDPNNIYSQDFITVLQTLANQTTLAVLNIRQRDLLQSLYTVNVERQEKEKADIARDLHDVILPSLGYLVELQSSDASPNEFEQAVQQINDMIREIMSGLRPTTLDMGLYIALEELADQPEAQIGGQIKILMEIEIQKPVNYDRNVELHLYRIVQQACRNTLEHAEANSILISGILEKDRIDLTVQDDGIGLPVEGMPKLSDLLAHHHFGLANIYERSKIIGATVSYSSKPNQGTKLHVVWEADGIGYNATTP